MHVLVLGLNHRTAPVLVREKVAISKVRTGEALLSLQDYVPGVVLSTCNRTEIYAGAKQMAQEAEKIKKFLSDYSGLLPGELESYLYSYHDKEAVKHLFDVASGLDSMIVGEYEVLGQVGYALDQAEATHRIPLPMLNLFRRAVGVGRRVREETEISRNPVSISATTVALCRQVFPDISACHVLVIGAGEAGKLAVEALVKSGVSHIVVTSRSYSHAQELAFSLGGQAIAFHHMGEVLRETDIVISCSGSPHFVLEPPAVTDAMQSRPQRPLLLIDIAVPRDIDPEVKACHNVFLHDIDNLVEICGLNHQLRQAETQKAAVIVEEEVAKFMDWWSSLGARPTIAALVSQAESVRQAQLAKTLDKLDGLSEADRLRLEAMTRAIVKNILHKPITCLKNNGKSAELLQATQELFGLSPDNPPGK